MYNILTFGWYIRYLLEINQYMLISSVNEIYEFNFSQPLRIISFIFSIWVICLCISFIAVILYLSVSYEITEGKHNKIEEIFSGVKMEKKYKVYVSVLLIRRALFVTLLITLVSVQPWLLISILSFIQLWYFIYIMILRPFIEIKWNIIEIINELYFFILLTSLIFVNKENDWSFIKSRVYMWIIASNTIWVFMIVMSKLIS